MRRIEELQLEDEEERKVSRHTPMGEALWADLLTAARLRAERLSGETGAPVTVHRTELVRMGARAAVQEELRLYEEWSRGRRASA